MPTRFKGDHNFQGDRNVQSGNDVISGNRFIFNIDGPSISMLLGFFMILCSAALIYLIMAHGSLVTIIVITLFIGTVIGLAIVGVCFVIRSVSATRTQLRVDRAQEEWSRVVYPLGSHVVLRDMTARTLTVHNARDVVENRHFAEPHALPAQAESLMPSFDDLTFEKER